MAQLKDLIVNGPTRLIGPAYGKITSADTVPVVNGNAQMAYGQQSTIATICGVNITATLPAGGSQGSQGAQGDQGAQGKNGTYIYTNYDSLHITGMTNAAWTGTTGSNSGTGKYVYFTGVTPMDSTYGRQLTPGDMVGFWGQDTDGNGHLNLAYVEDSTSQTGSAAQSITGRVVSAIIAEKGAQGPGGSEASLQVKGASTAATCFLLGTTDTSSTGTNATLSSSNTFRAGNATATGVYYKNYQLYASSDDRLKDYGKDIKVDLDDVAKIPKKYFTWKGTGPQGQVFIGTSAQKLKEVYPELVSGNEDKEMLAVAYDRLGVVALAAIDELHKENLKLKDEIAELKERLDRLENK